MEDGLDIGKSFADGFLKGFDGAEVGKALAEAIKSGMSALVSDAATLLPGGKEASSTSGVSAAILGAGALKVGSMGYKAYKGGKAIYNGAKGIGSAIGGITGISDGIQIARAAGNGGTERTGNGAERYAGLRHEGRGKDGWRGIQGGKRCVQGSCSAGSSSVSA